MSSEGDVLVHLTVYCIESFTVCHNWCFSSFSLRNAASTAWKPYFSGARTIVCKYPEGYGRYGK